MGGTLQLNSPLNTHPNNREGVGSRFSFSINVALAPATTTDHPEHEQQYTQETRRDPLHDEKTLAFPSQKIIHTLVKLTRGGDVDAVLAQAEAISTMKPGNYHEFTHRIQQLAENFQLDELEAFIVQFQEDAPND